MSLWGKSCSPNEVEGYETLYTVATGGFDVIEDQFFVAGGGGGDGDKGNIHIQDESGVESGTRRNKVFE